MQSYAIVGTGAVGGFIGCKLANADHDVHFVARSNYAALVNSGLVVREDDSEQVVRPISVFGSIDQLPPVDVVVVATKTTDIKPVSAYLEHNQPSAIVVGFHNGLSPELNYAASSERVLLGGVAYLSAQLLTPTCVQVEGEHHLIIGPQDATNEEAKQKASEVVEQFRTSGLHADSSTQLSTDRWHKVAWSLMFAGPCTILNVDTNELARSQTLQVLQESIFEEAKNVAQADGVELSYGQCAAMIREASIAPGHMVSMTIDRQQGRSLEDDAIYGAVRRRALEVGIRTPVLDAVHAFLAFTPSSLR